MPRRTRDNVITVRVPGTEGTPDGVYRVTLKRVTESNADIIAAFRDTGGALNEDNYGAVWQFARVAVAGIETLDDTGAVDGAVDVSDLEFDELNTMLPQMLDFFGAGLTTTGPQ